MTIEVFITLLLLAILLALVGTLLALAIAALYRTLLNRHIKHTTIKLCECGKLPKLRRHGYTDPAIYCIRCNCGNTTIYTASRVRAIKAWNAGVYTRVNHCDWDSEIKH